MAKCKTGQKECEILSCKRAVLRQLEVLKLTSFLCVKNLNILIINDTKLSLQHLLSSSHLWDLLDEITLTKVIYYPLTGLFAHFSRTVFTTNSYVYIFQFLYRLPTYGFS